MQVSAKTRVKLPSFRNFHLAPTDVFLAPPALHIDATKAAIKKDVIIGAQNVAEQPVSSTPAALCASLSAR